MSTPEQLPAVAAQPNMNELIRFAIESDSVDAQKLHLLLDAQERIIHHEREEAFNTAMVLLRKELPAIKRNKVNDQTKSRYADLEAVKRAVDPLLQKHGFFERYEHDYPAPGVVGTTCVLTHERGHSVKLRVQFDFDDKGIAGKTNKTQTHAAASSMTYGERLSLCGILGLQIVHDDDGNLAGAQPITEEQAEAIEKRIRELGSDMQAFLQFFSIHHIKDLPQRDLKKAEILLNQKAKKAQNASA